MPSVTQVLPDLEGTGPVVDVTLAVGTAQEQALQTAQQSMPSPVSIRALIDTGASACVIQEGLAAGLGLTQNRNRVDQHAVLHWHPMRPVRRSASHVK